MLQSNKQSSLVVVLSFLFLSLFSNININAQKNNSRIIELNKNEIGNLTNAIKSDNAGLRKSGIYLAGKYRVSELSETLLEQLKNEDQPELRILLVRVLFIIDDQKYIDNIYELAINDTHPRVRKMASAIYSVMNINNSESVVEVKK